MKNLLLPILLLLSSAVFSQTITITQSGSEIALNVDEIRVVRPEGSGSAIIYGPTPLRYNVTESPATILAGGCDKLFEVSSVENSSSGTVIVQILVNRLYIEKITENSAGKAILSMKKPPISTLTTNNTLAEITALTEACMSGGGGGGANLAIASRNATTLTVTSDSGNDAVVPAATSALAGLIIAADKTKIDFVSVTQAVDLDAIETASHAAATVSDNARIDMSITGQQISADLQQNGATSGQVMKWNGSVWVPATVDSTGLTNRGISMFDIGQNGASTGQMFKWNGNMWLPAFVDSTGISNRGISMFDIGQNGATSGQVLKWNGNMWIPSTDQTGSTPALTSAHIFVGNGSNAATDVALSGDAAISNTGDLSIHAARDNFQITNGYASADGTDQNNLTVSGARMTLGPTAAHNITGLASATGSNTGKIIWLTNAGPYNITLKNEHASSTAANRFDIGYDFVLLPEHSVTLINTLSRWRIMSRPERGTPITQTAHGFTINSTSTPVIPVYIGTNGVFRTASTTGTAGTASDSTLATGLVTGVYDANNFTYTPLNTEFVHNAHTLARGAYYLNDAAGTFSTTADADKKFPLFYVQASTYLQPTNAGITGGGSSAGHGGLDVTLAAGNETSRIIVIDSTITHPADGVSATYPFMRVNAQDTIGTYNNTNAPPLLFGTSTTGGPTYTNHVYMNGWNLTPGGGPLLAGRPGIGESWEARWRPGGGIDYCEKHEIWLQPDGDAIRLASYTADNTTSNAGLYHTVGSFGLRKWAQANNDYFTVQGDALADAAGFSLRNLTGTFQFDYATSGSANLTIANSKTSGTPQVNWSGFTTMGMGTITSVTTPTAFLFAANDGSVLQFSAGQHRWLTSGTIPIRLNPGNTAAIEAWNSSSTLYGINMGANLFGTTPASRLSVTGQSATSADHSAQFFSSSTATPILDVRNDGRVSVNTASPGEELDVVGDVKVSTLTSAGNRLVLASSTGVLNESSVDPANVVDLSTAVTSEKVTSQTGTTITFTTSIAAGVHATRIMVIKNGIILEEGGGNDYTVSSTTPLTLTVAVAAISADKFIYKIL